MTLALKLSQTIPTRRLIQAASWLALGSSMLLLLLAIHSWIPVIAGIEDSDEFPHGFSISASRPPVEVGSMRLPTPEPRITPWFGIEPEKSAVPPPSDMIDVSQRNLHLLGISTSTSPEESFALVRSGRGEIEVLRIGDAAESGVELAKLLPNAAILKAGDHWEKLHIGDAPPDKANRVARNASAAANRPGGALQPNSTTTSAPGTRPGEPSGAPNPRSHRNGNPNLKNHQIRKRLDSLMATLQP